MKRYIGIGLMIIGIIMLFKSINISSFGFYMIGSVSSGGFLLVLLIISAVFLLVAKNKKSLICFIACIIAIIVSVIMGTSIHLRYMSLFEFVCVFIPLIAGCAITIEDLFQRNRRIEDKRDSE